MRDYRYLNVLMFKDDGRDMAVLVMDQNRTRLVISDEPDGVYPSKVTDSLLWPILELPEADLQMDDWYDSPVFDEVYEKYRAGINFGLRMVEKNGQIDWEYQFHIRGICGHESGVGFPIPAPHVSEKALSVIHHYANREGHQHRYGPDVTDSETLMVLNRGIPKEFCKTWDAPARVEDDPASREIVLVQGDGEDIAIFLRGYARVGNGPLFEIFVPMSETTETDLGKYSLDKFDKISNYVARYGAKCAKWIVSADGNWHSGTLCKNASPHGANNSPTPTDLVTTKDIVAEYLTWRATAYGQPIQLMTAYSPREGMQAVPFIARED